MMGNGGWHLTPRGIPSTSSWSPNWGLPWRQMREVTHEMTSCHVQQFFVSHPKLHVYKIRRRRNPYWSDIYMWWKEMRKKKKRISVREWTVMHRQQGFLLYNSPPGFFITSCIVLSIAAAHCCNHCQSQPSHSTFNTTDSPTGPHI